jgi:hypothetical protein
MKLNLFLLMILVSFSVIDNHVSIITTIDFIIVLSLGMSVKFINTVNLSYDLLMYKIATFRFVSLIETLTNIFCLKHFIYLSRCTTLMSM